jgi:threonine/homoserine/homoserine lactone efflux protein
MFDVASFFVFITLMAYTPGPNNIMSMGNASRFGFRKSFRFNLGMWAGFSFVMLLCALASATLAAFIPKITIVMKIAGAAYMIWLAWHTFRSAGVDDAEEGRPTFAGGAFLQLVNPKIYVYGFAAMSSWIIPAHPHVLVIVAFALFLAFYGFVATVAWAVFGKVFARLFSGRAKVLNIVLALLLVYCAVSLFL